MDEIEAGLKELEKKIIDLEKLKAKGETLSQEIRNHDSELLARMAKLAIPIVNIVGQKKLRIGKRDNKGEIYDPAYYPQKMIVIGVVTEPSSFRPDNPQKPVVSQECVLSEDGKFFDLMYSFDGFIIDSYLNPIDSKTAIEHYGYSIMIMLYSGIRKYLKGEDELIDALEKVISYVFAP